MRTPVIGFIGGTGAEGRGLAGRFALAGDTVGIGSRGLDRAVEAARCILVEVPEAKIFGGLNEDIARDAEVIFVTVPYSAQRKILLELESCLVGKIIVTVVAPVMFSKGVPKTVQVPEGSAALQAQKLLPKSDIVAAFQTVSSVVLLNLKSPVNSDVMVCGDDERAKEKVLALAEKIDGVRAIDGGGLHEAGHVENFTALLINVNLKYKTQSGIRITGV